MMPMSSVSIIDKLVLATGTTVATAATSRNMKQKRGRRREQRCCGRRGRCCRRCNCGIR